MHAFPNYALIIKNNNAKSRLSAIQTLQLSTKPHSHAIICRHWTYRNAPYYSLGKGLYYCPELPLYAL